MKNLNISKKAMLAVLSCSLAFTSINANAIFGFGSPIPKLVIDPKAIWEAKVQVEQLRRQVNAITGNGNYADILNNPTLRRHLNQYLPKGYTDIFQAAQRGDLGALQQVLQQTIENEKNARTRQTGAERAAATRLLTGASLNSMMNSLQAESYQLDNLVGQINYTRTAAQKQDLMNAISAKQAQLNLKMGQMNIMMKQAEWQQKQADRQAIKENQKRRYR